MGPMEDPSKEWRARVETWITTSCYCADGRIEAMKVNYPVVMWFDREGATVDLTPAEPGRTTTFKMDEVGRLIKEQRDDGSSFFYTYSVEGDTCFKHEPDGSVTSLRINPPARRT